MQFKATATGKYNFVVLVNGRPVVKPGTMAELADNGTAATAMSLKDRHPGKASIELAGGLDYWKIIGKSDDRLFAYVDTKHALGSTDSRLDLRTEADSLITSDGDSGPGSSSVIATNLSADEALLRVFEEGNDGMIGDYHLFVAAVGAADKQTDVEVNDAIANSKPITAGMVAGKFPAANDIDYWSFKADAGDTIVAIVDSNPNAGGIVDADLEIRDSNDKVLATGDNGYPNSRSGAVGPVQAPTTGTYHVRVADGAGVTKDYLLAVIVSRGPLVCSDGDLDGTEACDDGNTVATDGCDKCQVQSGFSCSGQPSSCAPICGDGLVKGAEGCDDGAKVATDGCSATCTVETGWQCAGVPSSCAAICGDGQALGAETCDDDNQTAGDGCNATCQIEDGWDCMNRPSGCAAVCGDGKALGDEGCDDGNTQDGDGCTSTCQAEAVADVPTETKGGCSVGHARGAGGYRGTAACALLALAMMRRRRR